MRTLSQPFGCSDARQTSCRLFFSSFFFSFFLCRLQSTLNLLLGPAAVNVLSVCAVVTCPWAGTVDGRSRAGEVTLLSIAIPPYPASCLRKSWQDSRVEKQVIMHVLFCVPGVPPHLLHLSPLTTFRSAVAHLNNRYWHATSLAAEAHSTLVCSVLYVWAMTAGVDSQLTY